MLLWFVCCVFGKVAKVLKMFFFWAFVRWLILVYLGLEGLDVLVVLVLVLLLFRFCFCFFVFALFLFCCWIVFGVVLVVLCFILFFVFWRV